MFELENLKILSFLARELSPVAAARIGAVAGARAALVKFTADNEDGPDRVRKAELKNRFRFAAALYRELARRYGEDRAREISDRMVRRGGGFLFRGVLPVPPGVEFDEFVGKFKEFADRDMAYEVEEESDRALRIRVSRCLLHEALSEMGAEGLCAGLCDTAGAFFTGFHPRILYESGGKLSQGDPSCSHEFTWRE